MLPLALYRSLMRADCEERAFMLSAVGISSTLQLDGVIFSLLVDDGDAAAASRHLLQYENERRTPPPPPPPVRRHAHVWRGVLGYALVLVGVAVTIASGAWGPEAFMRGALDGAAVQAGQWWRAWTALTLHVDVGHLIANLGAGAWFGWLAARLLGNGHAWFLIVTSAAAANLVEALAGPGAHRAVGASTAVFAALGLLSAFGFTRRGSLHAATRARRMAQRWAPLVAGLALLGWFGTEGEHTDLIAHLFGFVAGIVLGLVAATRAVAGILARLPQWLTGGLALASLALAWGLALA